MRHKKDDVRNRLIEDNLAILESTAKSLSKPEFYDDLIGCGQIALIEAADSWGGEDDFTAYAGSRVRNAMISFLRLEGPLPRSVYNEKKRQRGIIGNSDSPNEEKAIAVGMDRDAWELWTAKTSALENGNYAEFDQRLEWTVSCIKNNDQEMTAIVEEIFDSLHEDDRIILEHRILEGMSYEESASVLGIGVSSTKARYKRAVGKFKAKFLSKKKNKL